MSLREKTEGSKSNRNALLLSAVTLVILGITGAGCQHEEVSPFDPRKLGQAQRDASAGQSTAPLADLSTGYQQYVPRSRREPTTGQASTMPTTMGAVTLNEPRQPITLEDVVRRTVTHNLDIKVAGYGPAIEAARTVEAQAGFDPVFFTNAGADITDRATAGTAFSAPTTQPGVFTNSTLTRQQQQVFTLQSGVKQTLENGAQVEISEQIRQTNANPSSTFIDPYEEADLVMKITQPLLRNFGEAVNNARIGISRNTARISLYDFRKAAEEAAANAEQAYWQLVAAQRQVEIFERLLERTEQTADIIAKRLQGDANALQLAQAQADADTRRATLVRAQARVRDLSDQLKQLMNDPEFPTSGKTLLEAESRPLDRPVRFDLDELIDTALQHRLELAQQQLRIDNATITLDAARNNLLPQLNFVGSLNPMGLSHGFDGAVSNESDLNRISWGAALQLEIPIGNREARSIYRRTQLQRLQAMIQYRSLIEQIALDVKVQYRDVETTWKELDNYRNSKFSQEKALRAIQAQEDAGNALDVFFVRNKLDTQARLADAEAQEVNTLVQYNVSVSKLERAKGTLLRYNNITLEEEGMKRQLAR